MVEFAYSRIQKILSWILMFLIVFTQTFHVVWFQWVSAYASDYRDIVSIFVDKETYDEFSSQIRWYARNIQSYLWSTRVVIFPVQETISPFAIASLNEKLYYEWDGDGISRLVGTILIWNIPLPVVHREGKTFVSVFPYTDFTDKSFLFNSEKGYYEYSNQYRETSDADIWHWVINPNTGNKSTDSTALQTFFDKSEDFYAQSGKYSDANTLDDPYVFYYDGYHEQLATKLNGWKSYELYMKHQEDISYKRWNKDLANQITKEQGNVGTEEMWDMVDGIVSQLEQTASWSDQLESALEIQDAFNSWGLMEKQENQMNNVPDIKSKEIIQNLAKPFHEIINSQTIGTELKNVHNAGRYTSGTTVRADIVPLMVTKQDEIMNRILKDANGVLESFTDNLVVTWGLSRKIPVLTQIQFDRQEFTHWLYGYQPMDPPFVELKTTANYQWNNIANYQGYYIGADHTGSYIYKNYFFWKEGSDIVSTTGCTILRWSSRLVEANRAYNTLLALSDVTLLQDDTQALAWVNGIRDACFQPNSNGADIRTMTYWGWNTPLNIDNAKTAETGYMELWDHRYDSFVRPILDIAWMRQVDSGSSLMDTYHNSPARCLAHDDLILQPRTKQICNNWFWDSWCTPPYWSVADSSWDEWNKWSSFNKRLAINADDLRFSCSSTVNKKTSNSFEEYYQTIPTATCTVGNLRLDNSLVLSGSNPCIQYIYSGSENGGYQIISTFDPVTKKPITPMDPLLWIFYDYYRIDDSRYLNIDYKSIQSAMFHKSPTDEELSVAEATQMTPWLAIDRDRYVSFISAAWNEQKIVYPNLFRIELTDEEIVDIEKARLAIKKFLDISSTEVNALIASEIPPTSGIAKDIYNLFKNGAYPTQNIDYYAVLEKDPQVLKTVIQNVIWNNLKNATAKYSFIFEHYIDEKGKDKTLLPLHRTDYEISYMGWLGNAQWMRVLLDPEWTEEVIPPYIADIMKAYDTGINAIDAANVTEDTYNDNGNKTDDQCGSPDGVNIFFEWFPAIICWIQTLLPPKILAGSCTPSTIGQDSNNDTTNRVTPPTITGTWYQWTLADFFNGGSMKVVFDKNTINTNDTVTITSFFETSSGSIVDFDNTYDVVGTITKIEAYKEDGSFGVVYQSGMDQSILRKYVSTESVLTSWFTNGEAQFYIGSRSEDANITFQTAVRRYDPEWNPLLDVTSSPTIFKIRAGNINVTVQSGSEVVSSVPVQSNPNLSLVFDAISASGARKESVFPYTYSFIDDVSEEIIATGTVSEDIVPFPTSIFSRIGVYKIEVQDGRWVYGVSSFSVNPWELHEIRVAASSNYLVQWENTPVVIQLIDAYGNLTSGELYDLEISVTNGYIDDWEGERDTVTRSILDGALVINVGTKNSWSAIVSVREKNSGKTWQSSIQSIPFAKWKITLGSTPIAGWTGVTVAITVVDQNNQKISWFNGVALFDFPGSSGLFSGSTVQIINWEASTRFLPGTVASSGIQPQVQIPGIKNIEVPSIVIEPNDPMYIEMRTTGNEAFEAKQWNTYEVVASLRDRYGNKVISPRNNAQVSFLIPDDYARYLRFENGSTGQVVPLWASWTARATIVSTGIPGTSYILGEVTPGLTSDIQVTDGNETTIISALSNAVIRLQTYYVFNKEKVDRIDYNSLYTVLLWAPYWDTTIEQYLGWELLFSEWSRWLAVTTLSDDPYIRETVWSFHPNGGFKWQLSTSPEVSVTAHTEMTNNGISVVFYDETYKENIARITPRFLGTPKMISCGFASGTIKDDCTLPDVSHIAIHSLDSSVVSNVNGNVLTLSQSGSADVFLAIDSGGRVTKHPLVNLILDESHETNGMYFRIEFSWTPIAELIYSTIWDGSIYSPDTGATTDGIIVEETSSRYTTRHAFNGATTKDSKWVEIYKKVSPFDKPEIDDVFSRPGALAWVEQFTGNEWLGWKGMNKMLLSFTSGDTTGEASKFFASYLTINLWDPVVHIDPKKVIKHNLDRTIGKTILMETRWVITGYKVFDVNNDEWEDIVVFYNDGHIQLIMNMSWKWRDMGYIAYVSDVKDGLKWVWDFSGDGYEDIVVTDQKGKLILLDNQEGRFTRKSVSYNENGVTQTLSGRLIQLEVFNMDNDKNGAHDIDDLVVMTEEWQISILYWWITVWTKTSKEFTRKIIEENLGISLDTNVRHDGWAVYFNELVIPDSFKNTNTTTSGTWLDTITDGAILSHVYYERSVDYYSDANLSDYSYLASDVSSTDGYWNPVDIWSDVGNLLSWIPDYARWSQSGDGMLSSVSGDSNENPESRIYIRSEFSESANILVSKRFEPTGDTNSLKSDDIVKMVVTIENQGAVNATNFEYLDDIPDNFILNQEKPYTLLYNNTGSEIWWVWSDIAIDDSYFDVAVPIGSLPAGSKVMLTYYVNVLPFVFGKMIVGLLEKWEVGDDVWGDIAFDTKNRSECDRDILMWRSIANREYEKWSKNFTDDTYSTLAPEIQDEMLRNSTDENGNGIPDYVDAGREDPSTLLEYQNDAKEKFDEVQAQEAAISTISPLLTYNPNTWASTSSPSGSDIAQIEQSIDTLMRWISCWFGWGGCLNMPVNWAPLAPGSAPNVLGFPMGDMSADTWLPIFSMLTGLQMTCWYVPCCIPVVWPVSPLAYVPGPTCWTPSAWWYLGTWSPQNTLRIFVTPTLTMWAGVAVCFGGPAMQANVTTPLWPLPPTAWCVVAAASLPFCKEDGSDGDAEWVSWVGTFTDTWNAGSQTSCDVVANPATSTEKQEVITEVNEYIRTGNKDNLQRLYVQNRNNASFLNQLSSRPLISMGNSSNGDVSIDLEIDPKAANIGDVVKIKNIRVPAFPEFIMDWVNRQVEEIINKLTILPTLYIILPDVSRMSLDGNLDGFTDKMSGFISWAKNSVGSFGDRFSNSLNGSNRKYNSIGWTAVWLRSAYEFMNKLPFIRVRTANIPINIPWIDGAQLEKEIAKLSSQIDAYKKEIDSKTKSWEWIGADNLRAGTSKFISSLEKNLRTLEDYKKFPEKLQKLLTWKQRYIEQIVCNIRTIEKMLGGWLKDNAKRFKKWVEFIIIIKSILKGWQAIIDLFSGYQQSCAVCKNERYDLRTWKVRLLSMLIPKIPVIKFPRWPDIVLDLHNIRLGLDIVMPEFTIKPVPIILPNLPKLFLPDAPNALINIPAIPTLPALPNLPNLPDLPSLPRIELPNLPPPPKIPNLFGGIAGVLDILKLLIKVVCYMQNTPLVPEWYAGERIAQLTQRQGKNPLDFLNLDMASMADLQIPGMKEIRVSTYLNLELKTDFIAEAARQIVRPINEFGADMRWLLPKEVGTTVDMRNTVPKNIRLNYNSETLKKWDATLFGIIWDKDLGESDIEEFKKIFISEVNKIENPFVRKQFLDIYSEMIHPEMGDANEFIASLEKDQKERFQEIYDYLDSEQKEVQNFENELNRLIKNYSNSDLLSRFSPSTSVQMAESSQSNNAINPYIEKINARSEWVFDALYQGKKDSYVSALETEGTILSNKLRSMRLAVNDGINTSSEYNPMKSWDTSVPTSVYQGVYAIDSGWNRVWLFDYFDELNGEEEIIRVDYDNDGDRDYLYMNGNGIFLKENHEFTPHKNRDTAVQEISSISLEDELLSPAPNYFHEAITTPNSINVTFAPIRKELDDYFRLEYYNRIYEFDLNTSIPQNSSSWRHVVDLTPVLPQSDGDRELLSWAIVMKNRAYVDNMVWDVLIFGPKLIKKSSNDSAFGVSVWRDVYVWNSSATISYRNKNTDTWNEVTLPKNIRIRFQSAMEVRVESGILYINNGINSDTPMSIYEYEKWFPILPDMKIVPAPGTNARVDIYANGVMDSVFGWQDYRMINLWTKSSYYSVAFDEENAWYHARMSTIYPEGRTSNVALTLMSPQFESDNEPPFFDMDRTLYVPVYTSKTLELLDLIQDTSGLSEIQMDIDVSSDANGNGIVDDDFVSLSDPSLSSIPLSLVSNSDFVVKLWIFEKLWIHQVRIKAVDNNNNSSEMNVSIIVYAPIPTIEWTENNTLSGYLDETVYGEPVDIVRVRDGNTSIVKPATPQKYDAVISLTGWFFTGSYNSNILTASGQVSIKDGENEAWIVREDTWKIQSSRSIDVIPATADAPMQLKMDNVYYQNIILNPKTTKFYSTSDFGRVSDEGVYIKMENPAYSYIQNPLTSLLLPGGISVISWNEFIFGIATDGNIYTNATNITFEYTSLGNYIIIKAKQNTDTIAEIFYKIQGIFVAR